MPNQNDRLIEFLFEKGFITGQMRSTLYEDVNRTGEPPEIAIVKRGYVRLDTFETVTLYLKSKGYISNSD